jgi:hypothetical protein
VKRSAKVDLSLVAALAVSLAGCNSSQMQRCVDNSNVVAPDDFCAPGFASRYHWGADPATGQRRCLDANGMPVSNAACTSTVDRHYHWYYGGQGSYAPGSVATEGSEFPRSGARYTTSSGSRSGEGGEGEGHGTSRGGFGGHGSSGRGG